MKLNGEAKIYTIECHDTLSILDVRAGDSDIDLRTLTATWNYRLSNRFQSKKLKQAVADLAWSSFLVPGPNPHVSESTKRRRIEVFAGNQTCEIGQ
jgi:hypothetical protein